ncbi:YciI family protein [Parvularcula marina]|uniref:YciI family protein n=1 Tax=Parvularcula marina TaxID=2292771 RepID=UPI0035185397
MKYMLLIAEDEAANPMPSEGPAFEAYMAPWAAYTQKLQEAGAMSSGAPLELSHTAKSVRVRDGGRTVQDGPYTDSKEQLGGFYIIEAGSMEEALNWAAECPGAKTGVVEVRPIPGWAE